MLGDAGGRRGHAAAAHAPGLTGQVFDIKRHDSLPSADARTPSAAALAARSLSLLEYRLASVVLRLVGLLATILPIRADRVVLATARTPHLEGNLLALHDAIRRARPDLRVDAPAGAVLVRARSASCATWSGWCGAWSCSGRRAGSSSTTPTCRSTSCPTDAGRRSSRCGTRSGRSSASAGTAGSRWPTRSDGSCTATTTAWCAPPSAREGRGPRAFRTPLAQVLPLGTPRMDAFARPGGDGGRPGARRGPLPGAGRATGRPPRADVPWPGRRQVRARRASTPSRSASRPAGGPPARPQDPPEPGPDGDADRRLRPGRRPARWTSTTCSPRATCSSPTTRRPSSSWALLRRPLVLVVPDLAAYEARPRPVPRLPDRDDRHAGRPTRPRRSGRFARRPWTPAAWDAFIVDHLGAADGGACRRFVGRPPRPGRRGDLPGLGDTLPRDVRHE